MTLHLNLKWVGVGGVELFGSMAKISYFHMPHNYLSSYRLYQKCERFGPYLLNDEATSKL